VTLDDRQELREKHADDGDGQCSYCLHEHYPCDVILTLDELDRAISAAEAYGITVRHLVERDIENKVLAVIHNYDETAESKLAKIWEILGRRA
jgi:hypothetical protein